LESVVRRAFASEAGFKLDLAILQGTGAGLPLGIVNGPSTIAVAKDVSQATATISATNLSGMWSRLAAPCRRKSVWICNEDAEAQISLLAASAGSGGANGMYYPQGHGGNECALLYGRPIVVAEQSSVLGTVGDIVLADLSQYTIIQNYDVAVSAEQNYPTDETIFRFRWRGDGKSLWSSAITPYNGSVTRSPFVQLAARP
jgi:HK97 family phage major capsid protein